MSLCRLTPKAPLAASPRGQVPGVGRRSWLAGLAGGVLAGCGFQLRQPPKLAFSRIAFVGFAPHSPMAAELRRQLAPRVRVLEGPGQAEVVLQALDDAREKSVVASTSAAQVRELQLRVKFNFRAYTPAGRELIARAELLLARDLSYRETAALAKEQEEAELYREMQADVAGQVLRRLASVLI